MTFDRGTNPGVVPLPDPAREGLPSREVKSYVHPLTNGEEVRKEHRAPKARVIKVSRTLVTLFVICHHVWPESGISTDSSSACLGWTMATATPAVKPDVKRGGCPLPPFSQLLPPPCVDRSGPPVPLHLEPT